MRNVLALVLLCLFSLLSGCGFFRKVHSDFKNAFGGSDQDGYSQKVNLFGDLALYKDCNDLEESIAERIMLERAAQAVRGKHQYNQGGDPVAADNAAPESATSGKQSFTNVQVQGVDEADNVKINDNQIFVARGDQIVTIDRASMKEVGVSVLPGFKAARNAYYYRMLPLQLYVSSSRLLVIRSDYETSQLDFFRVEKSKKPKLELSRKVSGNLRHTRMSNGYVILLLQDYIDAPLQEDGERDFVKTERYRAQRDGDRINGVKCSAIVKPRTDDVDFRLVSLMSFDMRDPEKEPVAVGVLGGGDHLYMTLDRIFIAKQGYRSIRALAQGLPKEPLFLTEVGFDSKKGRFVPSSAGLIEGRAKDQWAFHYRDKEDVLVVATTVRSSGKEIWQSNSLFVLQRKENKLKTVATVEGFGENEDIRAIRHVGDIAYVVTFRQTDPLFAFDLGNPFEPEKLGELKIPGFSTYLHPLSKDRLFGIGFDASEQGIIAGLQVSLFDTSDPRNLERIDEHKLGDRGSYSELTSNHHALFIDLESKLIGFPISEFTAPPSGDRWGWYGDVSFTGAVLYRWEDRELKEAARISHENQVPQACTTASSNYGSSPDVRRIYRIDDRIVSLSDYGLKVFGLDDLDQPTQTEVFSEAESYCDSRLGPLPME